MLLSAASELGLHCSPMSHKKDARLIWVKVTPVFTNKTCTITVVNRNPSQTSVEIEFSHNGGKKTIIIETLD